MKLFKKVSAAILAGVMALSMVACGTVTPAPEKTEEDKTGASTDAVILSYVNQYRNTTYLMPNAKAVETDDTMNKMAAAIVETLQCKVEDNLAATWTNTNHVITATVSADALTTRVTQKGVTGWYSDVTVFVVSKTGIRPITRNSDKSYTFTAADLTYEMTPNNMATLANWGHNSINADASDVKIGIAYGKVSGSNSDCAIVVVK